VSHGPPPHGRSSDPPQRLRPQVLRVDTGRRPERHLVGHVLLDATFPDSAPPEAIIALDKTLIDSGETVRLDGSGSSNANGRIDLYEWDIDGEPDYDICTGDPVSER